LNIYSVRDYLRQWFSTKGIPECPEFPAALSDGWHHPDVLLTMFGENPASFCVFQTLSEKSFCNIAPLNNTPGLIWLIRPFSSDITDLLADFLKDWQQQMYNAADETRFVLSSIIVSGCDFFERGSTFKILFNGAQVGDVRVFSSVFEEKLDEPVLILTMDVGKVLRCVSRDTVSFEPDWLDNAKLSRYSAFHAFSVPNYAASRTSDFLVHEIERITKKSGCSEFEKLNSMILLYNSSRGTFSECQKLRMVFKDSMKAIIKAIENSILSEKAVRSQ